MNLKVLPVVVGGVLAFGLGTGWGVFKKQPAEVSCSILLQPKLADAKGALAELAGDAASPIMVIKGTLESHSCLSKVERMTGVSEKTLEKVLQVKPIGKELRMELSCRSPEGQTGIQVLNAILKVLDDETFRISESFGTQQAAGLKQLIAERTKELERATAALADFQKGLKSSLDTVKSRQAVVVLQEKYQTAKLRLDTYTQQQEKRLQNPELGDWNPALQTLRLGKEKVANELKVALVTLGDENPEVLLLRQKLQIAQRIFSSEVERIRLSEQKNLQIKSAAMRASVVELERQLKSAQNNELLSGSESLQLAKLKTEVETVSVVLKNLRTAYEQARITGAGSPGTWTVLDAPYVLPEPTLVEKILKYGGLGVLAYLGMIVLTVVFRFGVSQRSSPVDE